MSRQTALKALARAELFWAIALAVSLPTLACSSGPRLRVTTDVLEKITIENKLLLFDAENELNIAIDARDQVVDEIDQIKEDMRRSGQKRDVAARDAEIFADKGDGERARLAALREVVGEARIEYLGARLEWGRERLDGERARLLVARAQFELAKARLVKKNNVPGASDIDLADFEEQIRDYSEDVGSADLSVKEAEIEMKQAEASWLSANKALESASGGALGSRWLE